MISDQELRELYRSKIKPNLIALEKERKGIATATVLGFLGLGIAVVLGLITFNSDDESLSVFTGIFTALVGVGAIAGLIYANSAHRKFKSIYKRSVVAVLLKGMNPDWKYRPDHCITSREYRMSDLFRKGVDRYRGDDLVIGKIDKTDFRSSELHTQYKKTSRDSKGNTRTTWHTIFKGLFFHADFNKHFRGRTYVHPDVAENLLGNFGKFFQKIGGKAKLVSLENPEFEKLFVVHSTDPQEARYILTPTIMEAMVEMQRFHHSDIHFSFVGSRVFCALEHSVDLFEPSLFGNIVNFKDIRFMRHLFSLNAYIIQQLELNTRIWTKE